MKVQKVATLVTVGACLVSLTAAHILLHHQEKQITKLVKTADSLLEVSEMCIPYVPSDVAEKIDAKLAFDRMVIRYDD